MTGSPPPELEEETTPVADTGGSQEPSEATIARCYSKLRDLWAEPPGTLFPLDAHLWARMKRLDHLSRCYIFEENEYRQFGIVQNDWQRLVKFLQWDLVGIIVLNITRQKALCYQPGKTPAFADIDSALFWLRSFPTALGIMQRSRGEEIEYAHVELWWGPKIGRASCRERV